MKIPSNLFVLLSSFYLTVGADFTYFDEGGKGPSDWANLEIEENQCGGTSVTTGYGQSPIAIYNKNTCNSDMMGYSFQAGDCTWDDLIFSIDDHSIKVSKGESCSLGTMIIPQIDKSFDALQLHVHTSSEHSINGQYYEAELHVVHDEINGGSAAAVFAIMLSSGNDADDHKDFENFLRGWEQVAKKAEETTRKCCILRRVHQSTYSTAYGSQNHASLL